MAELFSNFQGYLQLNIPRIKWIILLGIVFFFLYCFIQKKDCTLECKNPVIKILCGFLLSLNCSFIFVMTLLGRKPDIMREYRLIPFESYSILISERNMELLLQIIVNILMFVALGILLPSCFRIFEKYRNVVLFTASCSFGIELIQLIFKVGMFEVDDMIHNVLGVVIGSGLHMLCNKVRRVN